MTVMLVDDEAIILGGVERFLKRKWPELRVRAFDNGFDALDSIKSQGVPELLITDISMPEMDGIELVEKAAALGLKNSVMLTGYDEFSLAQRALRLRALDYLLKPVDKEQLYAIVESVMREAAADEERRAEATRAGLRLICLYGASQDDLIEKVALTDVFGEAPYALLLLLDEARLVREELAALLSVVGAPFSLDRDGGGRTVWLCPVAQENRARAIEAGKALSTKPYFLGMALAQAKAEALHQAYAQALEGTESGLRQAVDAYVNSAGELAPAVLALDSLFYRQGRFGARLEMMRRFLSAVDRRENLWSIAELLCEYPQKPEKARRQALEGWLCTLAREPRPRSREVLQGRDYIDRHLTENLSLTQVAGQVFLPPSYFSTLFHKETGMTFVDYVNRSRVNEACLRILSGEDRSVESVAADCGYENPHYFFKVFKTYTGATPGQFRQKAR